MCTKCNTVIARYYIVGDSEPGDLTLVAVSQDSFPYKRCVETGRVVTGNMVFVSTKNLQNMK